MSEKHQAPARYTVKHVDGVMHLIANPSAGQPAPEALNPLPRVVAPEAAASEPVLS